MSIPGFIGIDIGTQGLSVLFTDEDLNVLATGEGSYGFVTNEEQQKQGCYEQKSSDWLEALKTAMEQIHDHFGAKQNNIQVLAIGISGQMHGEVLFDKNDQTLEPVRLWCDARNAAEGEELTNIFQFKVPKRATCARFLWTVRNRPVLAEQTRHVTTPAGWMTYMLTGEYNLGSGDAAGIFPLDSQTQNYDSALLEKYNQLIQDKSDNKILPMEQLLPNLRRVGQDAGFLTASGAALLGIALHDNNKIPIAAGEGDQVAALAGSLIGNAGTISCSFGTSVCANVVADPMGPPFKGVSPAVDHFTAADGKPIHMVWLRNGTTFLNTIVESYGSVLSSVRDPFAEIMPALVQAPDDCGGLLALPFMDDEPGLGVRHGGSALIMGWNGQNRHPGHVAKAALLSTIFNLKNGCEVLERQGSVEMREIVLSGGLVKTPECGQIVANVFNLPVTLLQAADEGCSWGACVMANYRHYCYRSDQPQIDWATFLESKKTSRSSFGENARFTPQAQSVQTYEQIFQKYKQLMQIEPELRSIMSP